MHLKLEIKLHYQYWLNLVDFHQILRKVVTSFFFYHFLKAIAPICYLCLMIFVSCVGSSWKRWLWQVRTQQWGVWSGTEDAWLWWWRPETWRQWLLRKIRDNIVTISWLTLHHHQLIRTHSCETYPQLTAHQVSLYK